VDKQIRHEATSADIAAAERVLGIEQTAPERALIAQAIAAQIDLARARRAVTLDDDLAPACVFEPRLPGFDMPDPGPLILPRPTLPFPGAEDDEAIAFAPASAQAAWIRAGELSAVRLTTIYFERIARLDPALGAFARLNPAALDDAAALDHRAARGDWAGPLHGVPWACKDLIDTAGIITDWGAEPFRDRLPPDDAVVVRRLRAAGAVLLGKTVVGALGYGDVWHGGRTRNPWNPDEGASGSSSGSAAAVAAGLCGFALGTETLGSIVAPAARCGAVGLRPSFGRIARTGVMPLCPSLDRIGPLCRDIADTALVLAALNGADPGDPSSRDIPFGGAAAGNPEGLRLGVLDGDFAGAECGAARWALDQLRALGVTLVRVALPKLPWESLVSVLMAEAAASFEPLTLSDRDDLLARQDEAAWPNQFRLARFLSAVDHVQLDRLRRRGMQAMADLFAEVDLLAAPFAAGPLHTLAAFTGHPCLCMPIGFTNTPPRPSAGLAAPEQAPPRPVPAALCLWGRLFDEARLLAAGHALAGRCALDLRPPLSRRGGMKGHSAG
jgi:Asp-tRNA(Asn)/Glu-tRNA(Gln) amidotransferase A subunit family amidase